MNKKKITGAKTSAKCYISAECDIWNVSLFNHTLPAWQETGNMNDCSEPVLHFPLVVTRRCTSIEPDQIKACGGSDGFVFSLVLRCLVKWAIQYHYQSKTRLACECCFFLQWWCFHEQTNPLLDICHHAGCGEQLQMHLKGCSVSI